MNTPPAESGLARTGVPPSHWRVRAQQTVTYEVHMMDNVLDPANPALIEAGATVPTDRPRRFVVVDATIHDLYGRELSRYLDHHNCEYRLCVLSASEEAKTMEAVFTVVSGLDSFGISRRHEPVIGIGGGIILDIVGLASSLYRRSTPYVRVPTSLLGLVDAGVGIKTGVNFACHKNRLGSYFASSVALLDRSFLATMDERHISNGLAEILKIALVKDARLFWLLEEYAELLLTERLTGQTLTGDVVATDVFSRAVGGMLEELQPNLWEKQLERLVDYGHSFSPTLEMRALPALLHGEAVTVDMALTTVLAEGRGLVARQERERIFDLMRRLRLPVWHPLLEPELLEHALRETTRHRDGLQRMPIPVGIGGARFVNDVTLAELSDAAGILRELDRARATTSGHRHAPGKPVVTDVDGASDADGTCVIRHDGMSSTWEAITWSSLPPGASCDVPARSGTDTFCFILAGEGELLLDDVPHPLLPGHLIAHRSGTVHRFKNLGTADLSWLVIAVPRPPAAPELSENAPTTECVA